MKFNIPRIDPFRSRPARPPSTLPEREVDASEIAGTAVSTAVPAEGQILVMRSGILTPETLPSVAIPWRLAAPPTLTIATGVITRTQEYHIVDTEAAAATDDLDTINGGVAGDLLFIRPAADARTIVVRHNTGNILCLGNASITLDDAHDFAILIYDGSLSKWVAR